jgi:hypothetical protein
MKIRASQYTQHLPQLQTRQDDVSGSEGGASEKQQDSETTNDNAANPEGDKDTMDKADEGNVTTRAGRVSKPPPRFDDYVPIESVFSIELDTCEKDDNPVVYAVSPDPDVLQYHQANETARSSTIHSCHGQGDTSTY